MLSRTHISFLSGMFFSGLLMTLPVDGTGTAAPSGPKSLKGREVTLCAKGVEERQATLKEMVFLWVGHVPDPNALCDKLVFT